MLSNKDIQTFERIYLGWPRSGLPEVRGTVLPEEYILCILQDDRVDPELKELAEGWLEGGTGDDLSSSLDDSQLDLTLAGNIGYPLPGELIPHKFSTSPIDVEMVRDAVKENVACSL